MGRVGTGGRCEMENKRKVRKVLTEGFHMYSIAAGQA